VRVPPGYYKPGDMRDIFFSIELFPRYVGYARNVEEYFPRGNQTAFEPIGQIPQVERTYAYFEETYGACCCCCCVYVCVYVYVSHVMCNGYACHVTAYEFMYRVCMCRLARFHIHSTSPRSRHSHVYTRECACVGWRAFSLANGDRPIDLYASACKPWRPAPPNNRSARSFSHRVRIPSTDTRSTIKLLSSSSSSYTCFWKKNIWRQA